MMLRPNPSCTFKFIEIICRLGVICCILVKAVGQKIHKCHSEILVSVYCLIKRSVKCLNVLSYFLKNISRIKLQCSFSSSKAAVLCLTENPVIDIE